MKLNEILKIRLKKLEYSNLFSFLVISLYFLQPSRYLFIYLFIHSSIYRANLYFVLFKVTSSSIQTGVSISLIKLDSILLHPAL